MGLGLRKPGRVGGPCKPALVSDQWVLAAPRKGWLRRALQRAAAGCAVGAAPGCRECPSALFWLPHSSCKQAAQGSRRPRATRRCRVQVGPLAGGRFAGGTCLMSNGRTGDNSTFLSWSYMQPVSALRALSRAALPSGRLPERAREALQVVPAGGTRC